MKAKQTFFSFIIPAYNCENYLENCVMSILNQNLSFFEILIVDDGSHDGTYEVATKMQNAFPKQITIFTKKNGGAASARNFGLEKSIGDYIIFVDSDDLIFGDDLKKCIEIMKNKKVDLLISDISLLICDEIKRNEFNSKNSVVSSNVLEYISYLPKFPGSCCSKIFSRKFLDKIGVRFIEGIVNEDIDFMINCFINDPVLYHSNLSWYLYRQNVDNSVTNTIHPRNCIDMFKVIERNLDIYKDRKELNRIFCYEYTTLFYYYNRLEKKEKNTLKVFFEEYKYLLKKRFVKEKIIYCIYSLFNINVTAYLISAFYNIRRRKSNEINK